MFIEFHTRPLHQAMNTTDITCVHCYNQVRNEVQNVARSGATAITILIPKSVRHFEVAYSFSCM